MGHELTDRYVNGIDPAVLDAARHEDHRPGQFPKGVLEDRLRRGWQCYSVPVNIHRANVLWFNKKVFTANNLKPPDDVRRLLHRRRRAQGEGDHPTRPRRQGAVRLGHLFETILSARSARTAYKGLWTGATQWDDAKVTDALNTLKKMLGYINRTTAPLTWDQANDQLIAGKAAMTIMGDWTNGDYTQEVHRLRLGAGAGHDKDLPGSVGHLRAAD